MVVSLFTGSNTLVYEYVFCKRKLCIDWREWGKWEYVCKTLIM